MCLEFVSFQNPQSPNPRFSIPLWKTVLAILLRRVPILATFEILSRAFARCFLLYAGRLRRMGSPRKKTMFSSDSNDSRDRVHHHPAHGLAQAPPSTLPTASPTNLVARLSYARWGCSTSCTNAADPRYRSGNVFGCCHIFRPLLCLTIQTYMYRFRLI